MTPTQAHGRTDVELLAAHVAGDHTAFDEIFRRHRDRMWAVALRTTGDRELAADCVQEAFISAFRRAGSFRGDSAVSTWLHRIVVNACLDQLRRRRAVVALEEKEPVDPYTARTCASTSRRPWPGCPNTIALPWSSSTCTRCRSPRPPRSSAYRSAR